MKYSPQLLEYFRNRTHAGRLDCNHAQVYFAQTGQPENQEIFALYVEYQTCLVNVKFQAAGSVALIAAGEFICRWMQRKTVAELENLNHTFILEQLNLSTLNIPAIQLILLTLKKIVSLISSSSSGS